MLATVAVTVAVPGLTAVASPDPLTATIPLLVLAQDTVCPVTTVPVEVLAVAVSWTVTPTPARVLLEGEISTLATAGGDTVTTADPPTPPTVAVIAAVPGLTAVTRPDDPTVATPAFEVVHEADLPVTAAPSASLAAAWSCTVAPMVWSVLDGELHGLQAVRGLYHTVTKSFEQRSESVPAVQMVFRDEDRGAI